MEVLTNRLKNPKTSSIYDLIDELGKEIESIETSIRDKLNVRDEEHFRDCFQEITKFTSQMNGSIDNVNGQLKSFEAGTVVKIKELREMLLQRNKQLSELSLNEDKNSNIDRNDRSNQSEDGWDVDNIVDTRSESSPLPIPEPVDEDTVRKAKLTQQLAGEYIVRARKLVNDDLFPLIQVGDNVSQIIQSNSPTINQSIFSFPNCKVSQSIFDLIELLREMMKFARQKQDKEERFLVYQAARSVMELYLISLNVNHRKKICELHTYSAIFHNNCLFVAFSLTTLPTDYGLKKDDDDFIVTFIDFIPALKESAYETIIDQMKRHKQIIVDFLNESSVSEALNAAMTEDSSANRSLVPFYKALKQGLTYITQIKKSLIGLFPPSVCNKLVGTLVNCLIAEIVEAVLSLEDIPADTASKLGNILNNITQDTDDLMKDFSLPYGQVIPKWLQFQEIKIILQASLKDIVDRWADGNGPLAAAFSSENVKSLIRSLFQNTERRSAALARIK